MTNPIKLAIVGLGRAGWGMHCKELEGKEEQYSIMAAYDPITERMTRMHNGYEGLRTYNSYEELLDDPEIELVDIASRTIVHEEQAIQALRKGKSVFLEKPIALSYEGALRIKEAAEQSAGRLFIRHNRRFDPDFVHVRELVESGVLGDVFKIKLRRHGYSRRDDWQTIKEHGGGQLLNWGPHIIDHGLRLLGSPVVHMWSDLKRIAAVGDAEDHVNIMLRGDNGRVADLEISGGMAVEDSPLYQVFGTKGALMVRGGRIYLKLLDPARPLPPKEANPGVPGETFGSAEELPWVDVTLKVNPAQQTDIWNEMYRAFRHGESFPVLTDEAVEVMRIVSEVKRGTGF